MIKSGSGSDVHPPSLPTAYNNGEQQQQDDPAMTTPQKQPPTLNAKPAAQPNFASIRGQFRRSFRRPDTASTTASFAATSPDLPSRPTSQTTPGKTSVTRIGRSFEALLASDETYVLQETFNVARDQGHLIRASMERANSYSSLSSDGHNRVVLERKPKWEEQEANGIVASVPLEDLLVTPITQDTPRISGNTPFRQLRSQDRMPPVTNEGSGKSSYDQADDSKRRSYLRQGGTASSPDLKSLSFKRITPETVPPLPTDRSSQYSNKGFSDSSSALSATAPSRKSESSLTRRAQAIDKLGQSSPSPGQRNTPSRTRSRTYGNSEGRDNSPFQPKNTKLQPRDNACNNESMSLAQEVLMSSPTLEAEAPATGGSFRDRMKKTSGFLRKLRGDIGNNQKKDRASKAAAQSQPCSGSTNSSSSKLASNKSLSRKDSQASVLSEGANSIYSNSSGPTSRSGTFVSADQVPVPSIPSKYAKALPHSTSAASTTVEDSAEPRGSLGVTNGDSNLNPGRGPPPRARASSRAPSAPMESSSANPLGIVLPQRSSSASHGRAVGGSDASAGDVRMVIRDWEHEMDDALKDSALDLDKKTEFKPKAAWGPSPKLPDLNLPRYKERSGSFMEDGEAQDKQEPEPRGSSSLPTTPLADAGPISSRFERAQAGYPSQRAATYDYPSGSGMAKSATSGPPGLGIAIYRYDGGSPSSGLRGSPNKLAFSDASLPRSNETDVARLKSRAYKANSANNSPVVGGSAVLAPDYPDQWSDSPAGSVQTRRSSTRNSTESVRNANSHRASHLRGANSGASLTSARSFETAAESTGLNSADPARSLFIEPGTQSSVDRSSSPTRNVSLADRQSSDDPSSSARDIEDVGQYEDSVDPEQSIRLITKPSGGRAYDEVPTPTDATVLAGPVDSTDAPPVHPNAGLDTISEGSHSTSPSTTLVTHDAKSRRASFQGLPVPSSTHSLSPTISATTLRNNATTQSKHSMDMTSLNEDDAMSTNVSIIANPEKRGVELAAKCWAEDVTFLKKEKIAEWLGGIGTVNKAARISYFANFDFTGLRVDVAFRRLCEKLFLRAETQQVDRILSAFSQRYYQCNPDTIFGSADNIHSVVFSLLLLNTDLHVANIQDRMTRTQFVRNTMSAISEQPEMPADDSRSSFSVNMDQGMHSIGENLATTRQGSLGIKGRLQQAGSVHSHASPKPESTPNTPASEASSSPRMSMATLPPGITVSNSYSKATDVEMEAQLKEIYFAIKSDRILLPTPETGSKMAPTTRRRIGTDRVSALKRGSIRGIQGLLGGAGMNSMSSEASISPPGSSVASRSFNDPWSKSATSLASSGSVPSSQTGTATLGFASTLTQTIIREAQDEDAQSLNSVLEEPDDDELALMGPPWAKEGSLTRKHYWEAPGKRAKDKNWTDVFVVVQKGVLSMFKFGDTRAKTQPDTAAAVGGGNWLSNATPLGEVNLAHTLANALPPPGYNRTRPHVFALTLPGGVVYFFQAGHEELVHEWVQTCNYWAARQSKEPLPGGVSNMEYGWNKVLPIEGFEELDGDGDSVLSNSNDPSAFSTPPDSSIYNSSGMLHSDTRSIRSGRSGSGRSIRTRAFYQNTASLMAPGTYSASASPVPSLLGGNSVGVHANECIFINDWKAPALPTVPSTQKEEDQLDHCLRHMSLIEADLTLHNELRQPMLQLYSPRGQNYAKSLANWEHKSNHLLQELVKYQCYVESLKNSVRLRAERRGMKEVDSMMRRADEEMSRVREAEEGGPVRM